MIWLISAGLVAAYLALVLFIARCIAVGMGTKPFKSSAKPGDRERSRDAQKAFQ